MDILSWILTFTLIGGQLIKLPIGTHGGATLLDIAVIFFCILGLVRSKLKLSKPPLFFLLAMLFIIVALFSLALTPLHLSPVEFFTSLSYSFRFSLFVLLGWIIYSNFFSSLQKNIPSIFIFSGIVLAVLGLLQFIFLPDLRFLTNLGWDPHYFRTASTFFDPNFLGAYLVLTLLLIQSNLGGCLDRQPRVFYSIFAIIYLALLTTFSRGAYLAFLVSFMMFSFLNKSIKWAILTLLLFSVLIASFFIYQRLVALPRNIDRAQSAEFRFSTWQQGWQIFSSNPIFGIGFNAYKFALKEYKFANEQFLKQHGASTNDSSLLYVVATTGLVGLSSFLFFLFSLAWINKHNLVLLAGLSGLIIQSFFANTLFYPPLLLWIVLMASLKRDHRDTSL